MARYEIISDGKKFALKRTRLRVFKSYLLFSHYFWVSQGDLFPHCWTEDRTLLEYWLKRITL